MAATENACDAKTVYRVQMDLEHLERPHQRASLVVGQWEDVQLMSLVNYVQNYQEVQLRMVEELSIVVAYLKNKGLAEE